MCITETYKMFLYTYKSLFVWEVSPNGRPEIPYLTPNV